MKVLLGTSSWERENPFRNMIGTSCPISPPHPPPPQTGREARKILRNDSLTEQISG